MTYYYDNSDRVRQLTELKNALESLIAFLEETDQFKDHLAVYREALKETAHLLSDGFDQKKLTALSQGVPSLFPGYKEWIPPLIKTQDGQWTEPEWYTETEEHLGPVLKWAGVLKEIGYY